MAKATSIIEPLKAVKVGMIAKGDGVTKPKKGDLLRVTYIGRFHGGERHGEVFDHTKQDLFSFTLGRKQVIRGWDAGFKHLSIGTKAMLQIPFQYAYGEGGIEDHEATAKAKRLNQRTQKNSRNKKNKKAVKKVYVIPPKQDLAFEVQLIGINNLLWDPTTKTAKTIVPHAHSHTHAHGDSCCSHDHSHDHTHDHSHDHSHAHSHHHPHDHTHEHEHGACCDHSHDTQEPQELQETQVNRDSNNDKTNGNASEEMKKDETRKDGDCCASGTCAHEVAPDEQLIGAEAEEVDKNDKNDKGDKAGQPTGAAEQTENK